MVGVLSRLPTVVIDGRTVLAQEPLPDGRGRVATLEAVLRALEQQGASRSQVRVFLSADAVSGVDDADALLALEREGIVRWAPDGADLTLCVLSYADEWGAAVVSNHMSQEYCLRYPWLAERGRLLRCLVLDGTARLWPASAPEALAGPQYAEWELRGRANMIDNAIKIALTAAMTLSIWAAVSLVPVLMRGVSYLAALRETGLQAAAVAVLLAWGVSLLYGTILESGCWRATLGKRLVGIMVTDLQGRRLSFRRSLLRQVWRLLLNLVTLGLNYLPILWTRRRQALHDMLAGTVVVKGRTQGTARPSGKRW